MKNKMIQLLIASVVIAGLVLMVVGTVQILSSKSESSEPTNLNVHHVEYQFEEGQIEGKSSLLQHYEDKSEHVIGRMYIPDTAMETPIVDSDYFFRRNLEGAYDSGGVPFTNNSDDLNQSGKNCVIYGHRLDSGDDFGMLRNYLDQAFYDAHDTIYIETNEGTSQWRIISVFTINIAQDLFSYTTCQDLNAPQDCDYFLGEILRRNMIETGEYGFKTGDSMITLSTCHYETDKENGRLVLVAVSED